MSKHKLLLIIILIASVSCNIILYSSYRYLKHNINYEDTVENALYRAVSHFDIEFLKSIVVGKSDEELKQILNELGSNQINRFRFSIDNYRHPISILKIEY